MRSYCGDNAPEHGRSEPFRLGIIAAAVITIVEQQPARQLVPCAVTERMLAARNAKRHEHGSMRDGAQRKDRGPWRQRRDFLGQIRVAAANLRRLRAVRGREALHRIGDPAVHEAKSIADAERYRPGGEAESMERLVEQAARMITRERATGAVGAMFSRCQADDQHPCALRAE